MLEILFEEEGLPRAELPEPLRTLYGGDLGFASPRLVANFVSTIDGVVAVPALEGSNRLIADDSDSDRLVMGLLRAHAGCVLIGSGTMRGSPRSTWAPEGAYPLAADAFAAVRRALHLAERPQVAILTASGAVDPAHPVLTTDALVLTTSRGAESLRNRLPGSAEVVVLPGTAAVDVRAALRLLRDRGHATVLSEAGPHVTASLLEAGLVDELFLTVSPLLAGRIDGERRLALVEGASLLREAPARWRLGSVRRGGQHLFLRYMLDR